MVNNQNFIFVLKSSLHDPVVNQKSNWMSKKIQRSSAKIKTETQTANTKQIKRQNENRNPNNKHKMNIGAKMKQKPKQQTQNEYRCQNENRNPNSKYKIKTETQQHFNIGAINENSTQGGLCHKYSVTQ